MKARMKRWAFDHSAELVSIEIGAGVVLAAAALLLIKQAF